MEIRGVTALPRVTLYTQSQSTLPKHIKLRLTASVIYFPSLFMSLAFLLCLCSLPSFVAVSDARIAKRTVAPPQTLVIPVSLDENQVYSVMANMVHMLSYLKPIRLPDCFAVFKPGTSIVHVCTNNIHRVGRMFPFRLHSN